MTFPRLFTCPTLATDFFKVEFEVNVAVIFTGKYVAVVVVVVVVLVDPLADFVRIKLQS